MIVINVLKYCLIFFKIIELWYSIHLNVLYIVGCVQTYIFLIVRKIFACNSGGCGIIENNKKFTLIISDRIFMVSPTLEINT